MTLDELLVEARGCRLCEAILEPRPVLRVATASRVMVIGQAPGSKVHASGRPWADRSGDHLLEWLGVDRPTFDDPAKFGILPMAFCYPGSKKGGDLPPPPICVKTWHHRVLEHMADVRLTLLVGTYAQQHYLGPRRKRTLTETVRAFREYGDQVPLPHPAWRSRLWMQKNPWFADEVLPDLRGRIARALA